jgi:hypothetical protein
MDVIIFENKLFDFFIPISYYRFYFCTQGSIWQYYIYRVQYCLLTMCQKNIHFYSVINKCFILAICLLYVKHYCGPISEFPLKYIIINLWPIYPGNKMVTNIVYEKYS